MDIEQFGEDHWSALVYVESRCVDHRGFLNLQSLRVNATRRPNCDTTQFGTPRGWQPEWGTRAKDGTIPDPQHDDLDCLDDMERAGLLESVASLSPRYQLTDKGFYLAAMVRKHKTKGGTYATFSPNPEGCPGEPTPELACELRGVGVVVEGTEDREDDPSPLS